MIATCNNGLVGGFYIGIEIERKTMEYTSSDLDTIINYLNNLRLKQRTYVSSLKSDSVTAAVAYANNKKSIADGKDKIQDSINSYNKANTAITTQNTTETSTLQNLMTTQSTAQKALDDAKNNVDKEIQVMKNLANSFSQNTMTIANLTASQNGDFTAMTTAMNTAKQQFDNLIASMNIETYNHPTVNAAAAKINSGTPDATAYQTALVNVNTR